MNEKIGFTIGKFAPFHKGHEYLIETALKEMDKVVVVVYDTDVISRSLSNVTGRECGNDALVHFCRFVT